MLHDGQRVLLLLCEFKNEPGVENDPYFQLLRTYSLYWEDAADSRPRAVWSADPCPCFLVEVVGPMLRVTFAASLEEGAVDAEPLTPFLHFLPVTGQPSYLHSLIAALHALRLAVAELREHYRTVDDSTALRGKAPPGGTRGGPSGGRDPQLVLP